MTSAGADQWVIASAAVTGGLYAWLKLRGAQDTPVQTFVTGWGVVYVSLSVVGMAVPGLAAGFAILILAADFLANGQLIAGEIAKLEGTATPATGTAATTSSKGKVK